MTGVIYMKLERLIRASTSRKRLKASRDSNSKSGAEFGGAPGSKLASGVHLVSDCSLLYRIFETMADLEL